MLLYELAKRVDTHQQVPTSVVPLPCGGCTKELVGGTCWRSSRNAFTMDRGWFLLQSSDGHASFTEFNRQCAGMSPLPVDDWVAHNVVQLPPITPLWCMGGGLSIYHEHAELYLWHGSSLEPEHLQRGIVKVL